MFSIFPNPQPSDYEVTRKPVEWVIGMNDITKSLVLVRKIAGQKFIVYDNKGRYLVGKAMIKAKSRENAANQYDTLLQAKNAFKRAIA
jgi:hypothetical protein